MMAMREIIEMSFTSHNAAFVLLVLSVIAGSLLIPANYSAYAHTFSTGESADFLSLVEQVKAETALISMNLQNNNVTLAQDHAEKVTGLLTNSTLDEIYEVNTRIASDLESSLELIEANLTSLASSTPQGQMIPQDRIQSINGVVTSIDDLLAEAVTVRVESDQRNNATTWALALDDLVNVVLSDYGNATGSFDLTDMRNMAGMEGMEGIEMGHHANGTDNATMMMDDVQTQMSENSTDNNTIMQANSTSSSSMGSMTTTNMTTTNNIVNQAAYQSAQYISNTTIIQLFTETLKPLTLSANGASTELGNATVAATGEEQQTSARNLPSSIDELEAHLLLLRDNIANKASPTEVMRTAHLQIHPLLMQMYGLNPMASPQ